MRVLPIATLALMLIATAGCTAGASYDARAADGQGSAARVDEPELARLLEGRIAGAPRSCLALTQMRDSQVFRGTIVYRTSNATVYRNDLNGCPELNANTIPVFRTPIGSLCSGEIVELVDRTSRFPIGACSVGQFVPYTRAAR